MLIAGRVKIPVLENKQSAQARSLILEGSFPFYRQSYFVFVVLAAFNSDAKGQMTLDFNPFPFVLCIE